MARVTVEDCLEHVPNRFQLIIAASARARELQRGHTPMVTPRHHEKATVTALREIAGGKIAAVKLRQLGAVSVPLPHAPEAPEQTPPDPAQNASE